LQSDEAFDHPPWKAIDTTIFLNQKMDQDESVSAGTGVDVFDNSIVDGDDDIGVGRADNDDVETDVNGASSDAALVKFSTDTYRHRVAKS